MIQKPTVCCVLAATLALVVVSQVPCGAQKITNFSGKWVFVPAKSEGTPTVPRIFNTTGAPAKSNELVIKQSPAALSIKIGEVDLKYKLDGSESNISADGRAGFPVGKATWEGNKLIVTMTQEVFSAPKADYVKVPLKEVYSLSNGVLTMER